VRVDHDARAVAVGLAEGHAKHQVCNLGPDARPAYAYAHAMRDACAAVCTNAPGW
jgi:hypothetical protein